MTSKGTQSAPAAGTAPTSSPRRAKVAERIDGAMTLGCFAMDVSSWISSGSSRLYRPMPCAQIGAPEMRQVLAARQRQFGGAGGGCGTSASGTGTCGLKELVIPAKAGIHVDLGTRTKR